jgi:tetrahydromethanopterin S-methyltransferase subunit B
VWQRRLYSVPELVPNLRQPEATLSQHRPMLGPCDGWEGRRGVALMAADFGRLVHLLRSCGMALMAAGALMIFVTLLHPKS